MSDIQLPRELASFEEAVRDARAPGFDWRAAYRQFGASFPQDDRPAALLFEALVAETEKAARFDERCAYHNPLHTLDTLSATALLCASAARIGFGAPPTHLLLLVMIGHDLRHPGGGSLPDRDIEQASADLVAAIASACGVSDDITQRIVSLILATRPERQLALRAAADGDPAEWLVGEADVLASLLPDMGLHLSGDLTREMAAAGQAVGVPFEAPAARLAFLRVYAQLSAPAQALGLGRVVDAQIADLVRGGA